MLFMSKEDVTARLISEREYYFRSRLDRVSREMGDPARDGIREYWMLQRAPIIARIDSYDGPILTSGMVDVLFVKPRLGGINLANIAKFALIDGLTNEVIELKDTVYSSRRSQEDLTRFKYLDDEGLYQLGGNRTAYINGDHRNNMALVNHLHVSLQELERELGISID